MALCQDVLTSVSFVDPKIMWPGYSRPEKSSGTIAALILRMDSLWTSS